jgi:signal recognition particle receptor subunit beta
MPSPEPRQPGSHRRPEPARHPPIPAKIVIAGGFGVGKTTAVAAISEIAVLTTEAAMTEVAAEIDRTGHTPAKTATTVALDFGRLTIDDEITLYLFGTPGQDRFGFMWRDLAEGALGALVIVDTRRLGEGYPAVDYFERSGLPFVVGVNLFDGRLDHRIEDVRWALAIPADTPVVMFDARRRASVRDALVTLLRHALDHLEGEEPAPAPERPQQEPAQRVRGQVSMPLPFPPAQRKPPVPAPHPLTRPPLPESPAGPPR